MAEEDQERIEDYLELDHYIEELRAGHSAHPPSGLTPTRARIYRIVALFRAATAKADQPRRAFVAALQARLEQEPRHPPTPPGVPFLSRKPSHSARKMRPTVSRRTVVRGGATAAASLVVGIGLGATIERLARPVSGPGATPNQRSPLLVPAGEGSRVAVAKLADLGENALRFATATIVGYLIRSDGREGEKPGVIAVSAPVLIWAASCSGTTRIGSIIAPVTAASSRSTASQITPGHICAACPAWKRESKNRPRASSSRSGCPQARPHHEVGSHRPPSRFT
jgi:hypothetical protein